MHLHFSQNKPCCPLGGKKKRKERNKKMLAHVHGTPGVELNRSFELGEY